MNIRSVEDQFDKTEATRRSLLKASAGATALAIGGGTPFLSSSAADAKASSLASEQLRAVGLSVTVQERILADFKAPSGVGGTSGTASTMPDAQTKILSGSSDYDCWEPTAERLRAVVMTKNISPIPTNAIKNWSAIRDTFTTPNPKWGPKAQITGQIWADASQTELWMAPAVYNYDSVGYNPNVLSAEEANSWIAIFDPKWRGKSGLNTDPLTALGQAFMAMNRLGLSHVENPGNPSAAEIDEAVKFIISKKKDGQFRALWGDFGELVNLLVSGEMVVCDAWQPAVMAVKAQGEACKYAVPKEGYRGWAIGPTLIASSPNKEAVFAYADYWLSGPPGVAVSEQGYYSPSTNIKKAMSPEKPWRCID